MKIKLYSITIDSGEYLKLAEFYAALLNWQVVHHDDEYAVVGAPGTAVGQYPGITIQQNPDYAPPVWPDEPGAQQQMEHLDLIVDDMEAAVEHAKACGAALASAQFSQHWTVMIDPDGHPFCLCRGKELFESPQFGLL